MVEVVKLSKLFLGYFAKDNLAYIVSFSDIFCCQLLIFRTGKV